MISRVQSFGNFIFELDDTMQSLFKEPRFLEVTRHVPLLQRGLQLLTLPPVLQAALGVCPKHKPFLDPFQFNFIMQVLTPSSVIFPLFHHTIFCYLPTLSSSSPGARTDRRYAPRRPLLLGRIPRVCAAVAAGAYTRAHTSASCHSSSIDQRALLQVCMVFSGLFQDKFVDQVQVTHPLPPPPLPLLSPCPCPFARHQPHHALPPSPPLPQVVAYLHEWTEDRGGAFVYWKDNSGKMYVSVCVCVCVCVCVSVYMCVSVCTASSTTLPCALHLARKMLLSGTACRPAHCRDRQSTVRRRCMRVSVRVRAHACACFACKPQDHPPPPPHTPLTHPPQPRPTCNLPPCPS